MKIFSKLAGIILNLFFPPRCEFCSVIINWIHPHKYQLCEDCLAKISFVGLEACDYCGKQLKNIGYAKCEQCTGSAYYSKILSACEYAGLLRDKLLEFKFRGHRQLCTILALFIIEKLKMTNHRQFDIILSVPIHSSKLKERGYNQSELLANEVAKFLSIPISTQNLIKKKPTESQSKLDKKDRWINVKDAFQVMDEEKINGKKVLLIDDIITTGATANECSKVLRQAGASRIYVATVATGKNDLE